MKLDSHDVAGGAESLSFDAVLFDAGGVLVIPDPEVLAPALSYYGATSDRSVYVRAHYGAMAAKSRAQVGEDDWSHYNEAYVQLVGVPEENRVDAAWVLARTRHAHLWRAPLPGIVDALRSCESLGVPMGVVSNASGQIEDILRRSGVCQVGPGEFPSMRCIIDSEVVGVTKPDPRIFDHALIHFPDTERVRIAYLGDSVTMDVEGSRAAGLTPVLIDPHDDAVDLVECLRVRDVAHFVQLLIN